MAIYTYSSEYSYNRGGILILSPKSKGEFDPSKTIIPKLFPKVTT